MTSLITNLTIQELNRPTIFDQITGNKPTQMPYIKKDGTKTKDIKEAVESFK